MKCTIELGPGGDLRLTTPTGRTLDLVSEPASIALLRRILYHAEQHERKPMSFPTQHVLDAWARGKAIDWSKPEPTVKRTIIEEAPQPRHRKPKKSRKAKPNLLFGIDVNKVDFSL